MTRRIPRNPSGLGLMQWLRAAGWGGFPVADILSRDNGATFEQLAAAWHNDEDPSEWRATAPKRYDEVAR